MNRRRRIWLDRLWQILNFIHLEYFIYSKLQIFSIQLIVENMQHQADFYTFPTRVSLPKCNKKE